MLCTQKKREESSKCIDMLQNLDISDSLIKLGAFIRDDHAVQEFMEEQFGKDLKIFVGDFTRKTIPVVADCPYIALTDFKKKEGQNIEFCEYRVTAFIGVSADETFVEEHGILMPDVYDVGAKFMTLIETIFNDKNKRYRPLSKCDTEGPYPLDAKHWVGKMELTWRIYQTLGTNYQEEI